MSNQVHKKLVHFSITQVKKLGHMPKLKTVQVNRISIKQQGSVRKILTVVRSGEYFQAPTITGNILRTKDSNIEDKNQRQRQ